MTTGWRMPLIITALLVVGAALQERSPMTAQAPAQERQKPAVNAPGNDAPAAAPLKNEQAKLSYALGMNLANQFKDQVDLDPAVFGRGFMDAFTGGNTQMTAHEAAVLVAALRDQLKTKQMAEQAAKLQEENEKAVRNQKEGESFLAANKSKEGVVTLPSGLQYKIVREGAGKKPTADDVVVCHYRGTLIDGTEFDSSYKRKKPEALPVKGVIRGWTEALQLMPVGSKWQLFIPSTLAYGTRPAGKVVGPNSTLMFEVELISIKEPRDMASRFQK